MNCSSAEWRDCVCTVIDVLVIVIWINLVGFDALFTRCAAYGEMLSRRQSAGFSTHRICKFSLPSENFFLFHFVKSAWSFLQDHSPWICGSSVPEDFWLRLLALCLSHCTISR